MLVHGSVGESGEEDMAIGPQMRVFIINVGCEVKERTTAAYYKQVVRLISFSLEVGRITANFPTYFKYLYAMNQYRTEYRVSSISRSGMD